MDACKQDDEEYQKLLAEGRAVSRKSTHYNETLGLVQKQAKSASSKYSLVFMCPEALQCIELVLLFPLHFRSGNLFKLTFLEKLALYNGGVCILQAAVIECVYDLITPPACCKYSG